MSGEGRLRLGAEVVRTGMAAGSVVAASAAFSGVFSDSRWIVPAALTVAVTSGIGVAGRRLRWWPLAVAFAQFAGLLTVLSALFSRQAILGVLPSPATVTDVAAMLSHAVEVVRSGVPPVAADPALQCLVCLGLGLVALLVDVIAVTAAAPAVAGLVLLCVFAVPASLSTTLLPWWSFAAGATGFALLLASSGTHRDWRQRDAYTMFGATTAMMIGFAGVIALLTGVVFTGVGTEGRLPGSHRSGFVGQTSGIGLQPFTSLRGQLDRGSVVELFRVRGLPQASYLRAMTLRKFDPQQGWKLDGLTQGVDAGMRLPLPEGTTIARGTSARVQIDPIGYRDPWLPMFGVPMGVSGMGQNWRYDPAAGIVFTQTKQDSHPYTERLVLPDPTPQELRDAHGPMPIDPAYLDSSGTPPQVADLARRITREAPTDFDKAAALNRYFTDPANGFTYDLQTAPPTGGDALSDFLFRGKRGFCEQFASSMAIMLRAVGIPSRVAIGFTAGYRDGDERVITTDDAHAWVEAYFPGWGWITFDPTPLNDGRTAVPQYLGGELGQPQPALPASNQAPIPAAPQPTTPQPQPGAVGGPGPNSAQPQQGQGDGGSGAWSALVVLAVFALALLGSPAAVRELRRRKRLRLVTSGAAGAANAAWREVLDEFWDRGTRTAPTDTIRTVADELLDRYSLDEDGQHAMHALVAAVEREWYAPPEHTGDPALAATLQQVLDSLARRAPLPWKARVMPRSVLSRRAVENMLAGRNPHARVP